MTVVTRDNTQLVLKRLPGTFACPPSELVVQAVQKRRESAASQGENDPLLDLQMVSDCPNEHPRHVRVVGTVWKRLFELQRQAGRSGNAHRSLIEHAANLPGSQPTDDRRQYCSGPVHSGVLVVAGGEAAPLLEQVEGPLDDVPPLVRLPVELRRATASCPTPLAVGLLVGRLRDHGPDPAPTQHRPVPARGVRLVPEHRVRRGPRPARTEAWDADVCQHELKRAPVVRLPRSHHHRQRAATPVDSVVNLARQPATRPPNAMTFGFTVDDALAKPLVIRRRPLCPALRASCSLRAGARG